MRKCMYLMLLAAMTLLMAGCEKKGNEEIIPDPTPEQPEAGQQNNINGARSLHLDDICFDFGADSEIVGTWMTTHGFRFVEEATGAYLYSRKDVNMQVTCWNRAAGLYRIDIYYFNPNMNINTAIDELKKKFVFTQELEYNKELMETGTMMFAYTGTIRLDSKDVRVGLAGHKEDDQSSWLLYFML